MFESFTFWLRVLAVLIAYLCVSVGLRWRAEEARRREREAQEPPGAALDVSAIAPQIQRLRQDHLAAALARAHQAYYRRGLIAMALRAVTSLAYFRRVKPEHETPKRAT